MLFALLLTALFLTHVQRAILRDVHNLAAPPCHAGELYHAGWSAGFLHQQQGEGDFRRVLPWLLLCLAIDER